LCVGHPLWFAEWVLSHRAHFTERLFEKCWTDAYHHSGHIWIYGYNGILCDQILGSEDIYLYVIKKYNTLTKSLSILHSMHNNFQLNDISTIIINKVQELKQAIKIINNM
jgi:hypothetical protein